MLHKIFEDQKPNPQGIYYLKIFHSNIWKLIIIDDYIPVYEENDSNAKPSGGKSSVIYKLVAGEAGWILEALNK